MNLTLRRFHDTGQATLGLLSIENAFQCFTLEDEYRAVKVKGETRIPAGRYQIRFRTEGGMHSSYAKKYPFHIGMLWLQNVPGFEWVYIHVGNTDLNTEGCILVGMGADATGRATVQKSVDAYISLYKTVSKALQSGEAVWVEVA